MLGIAFGAPNELYYNSQIATNKTADDTSHKGLTDDNVQGESVKCSKLMTTIVKSHKGS